jgi:hypothetical protein
MVVDRSVIPSERIEKRIFILRSQRVMLSNDLADIYQVEPRVLVQAVKRNLDRFPEDFMFQLSKSKEEFFHLKSQVVISSWGGLRGATPHGMGFCYLDSREKLLEVERSMLYHLQQMM